MGGGWRDGDRTENDEVSTGATPGIGVMKVRASGRSGAFESITRVTNVDAGGVERADVHALAIRLR
jgi:hypothetical protein